MFMVVTSPAYRYQSIYRGRRRAVGGSPHTPLFPERVRNLGPWDAVLLSGVDSGHTSPSIFVIRATGECGLSVSHASRMSLPFRGAHQKAVSERRLFEVVYGPRLLKSTRQHGPFGELSDVRHGLLKDSDMGHGNFLHSTG